MALTQMQSSLLRHLKEKIKVDDAVAIGVLMMLIEEEDQLQLGEYLLKNKNATQMEILEQAAIIAGADME